MMRPREWYGKKRKHLAGRYGLAVAVSVLVVATVVPFGLLLLECLTGEGAKE